MHKVQYRIKDQIYSMDIEGDMNLVPFICISKASKKHNIEPDEIFILSVD